MNHSGTEQLLSRNKTILPRFLQEICDLYHLGELAVQVISAENRYVSWKSSVWATREAETTWHGGREMPEPHCGTIQDARAISSRIEAKVGP